MAEEMKVERVFMGPPYVIVVSAPYPNAEDGCFTTCIGPIADLREMHRLLDNIGPTAKAYPLSFPTPDMVTIGMESSLVEGTWLTAGVQKSTKTPYSELEHTE